MNEQSVLALHTLVLNYRFERSHNALENCEQTNCILSLKHPSNVLAEASTAATGKIVALPATGSLTVNFAVRHTKTLDVWSAMGQALTCAMAEFHEVLHNPQALSGTLDDERIIILNSRDLKTEGDVIDSFGFFHPMLEERLRGVRYISITPLRNADDRQRVGADEDDSPVVVCKVEAGNQDFGVHTFAPAYTTPVEGWDFGSIVRQNVADTLDVMAQLKQLIPSAGSFTPVDKS